MLIGFISRSCKRHQNDHYLIAKRRKLAAVQLSSAFFLDSKTLDVMGEVEVARTSGLTSVISREKFCSGSTRAFFLLRSFSMSGSSDTLFCSLRWESFC